MGDSLLRIRDGHQGEGWLVCAILTVAWKIQLSP